LAYNEELAGRVREVLDGLPGFAERKMFGGLCFTLDGNICCGITGTDLMLRLGKAGATAALKEGYAREMDFTGKAIRSMIYVEPSGYTTDADLKAWLDRAVRFVQTLPPKKPAKETGGSG
jgi:TfoX/Sxy family transcriptional regulator of competence genes